MSHTNRPAIVRTIVSSAARTTSSSSGNLKDGTADFPAMAKTVALHFNVTAYTVDAGKATGMARFYVDTSFDGGTTWVPGAIPYAVTTSTAERVVVFRNGAAAGVNSIDGIKQATRNSAFATTTSDIPTLYPLNFDKRIRWELGDGSTGGTGISVTFGVYAFINPD